MPATTKTETFVKMALWLTRIVRQVALFMFHYFRFDWFRVVWRRTFFLRHILRFGSPQNCWMCAPCLEYTIMHNDEHKPFSAPAKLFCIFFLCLILSQKKKQKRGPQISILKQIQRFEWSESKNSSIVTRGFKHATNTCALRLKHSELFRQKDRARSESKFLIQFCFIINCSVKQSFSGVSGVDDAFDIVEGRRRRNETEPIIKRIYSLFDSVKHGMEVFQQRV